MPSTRRPPRVEPDVADETTIVATGASSARAGAFNSSARRAVPKVKGTRPRHLTVLTSDTPRGRVRRSGVLRAPSAAPRTSALLQFPRLAALATSLPPVFAAPQAEHSTASQLFPADTPSGLARPCQARTPSV